MRRLPWLLLALPALAVARALPAEGAGLYLRLAAATLCLLLPGFLLARALGQPGVSAALAWSLAGLFGAGAIMFAAHSSLDLGLGLYAGLGAAALLLALVRPRAPSPSATAVSVAVAAAGAAFGIALWHVAGPLSGDALDHLARVRKLEAFSSLQLRSVDEFKDGGLHPGYAFPLWHLLLALVARLGGADAGRVLLHEASVLCPLAFVVVYEAGLAVFRKAGAGLAVLLGTVAVIGLAPGHGGAFPTLALPATAARQLLAPAVVALFFLFVERPSRSGIASLAAAGLALALVHPTYALFVALPLAAYVIVRALLAQVEVRRGIAGLAALAVPAGAVGLWLLPIVRETASHNPSDAELRRSLGHYGDQLVVYSLHSYRLSAVLYGRTGAVAVAALAAVPLAALARRRRWAALVLGGTVVVAALTLIPLLFTSFSDLVSISQARRLVGFLPLAFAFAGGAAVLARAFSLAVLPAALAAGIALQLAYPGAFGPSLQHGGPAAVTWIAAVGGAAALVIAALLRRPRAFDRRGPLAAAAAALFVIPVAVSGFSHWSARVPPGPALTPGLVRTLHRYVPKGAVVFSDDSTAYLIAAAVPVYVNAAPPGHVADTKANRPYTRVRDALAFFRTRSTAILRRYHADFLAVDRRRFRRFHLAARRLYLDSRYALYGLRPRRQSR